MATTSLFLVGASCWLHCSKVKLSSVTVFLPSLLLSMMSVVPFMLRSGAALDFRPSRFPRKGQGDLGCGQKPSCHDY